MLSYFVSDSTITIFAISKKDFVVTQVSITDILPRRDVPIGSSLLQEQISLYRLYISES